MSLPSSWSRDKNLGMTNSGKRGKDFTANSTKMFTKKTIARPFGGLTCRFVSVSLMSIYYDGQLGFEAFASKWRNTLNTFLELFESEFYISCNLLLQIVISKIDAGAK